MDWFKGKFTGKPHISWENLWFPVDFPLNQSIEYIQIRSKKSNNQPTNINTGRIIQPIVLDMRFFGMRHFEME